MRAHMRKYLGIAILLVIGICVLGIYPIGATNTPSLKVRVVCPNITSNVQFNISLTLTNITIDAISFNKIAILYVNPDLSVKGPYEVTASGSVPAGQTQTISVPFKIITSQAAGTIVPIAVALWAGSYSQGNERGGGFAGAKIGP